MNLHASLPKRGSQVLANLADLYPELATLRLATPAAAFPQYRDHPVEFARDVLRQTLTLQQGDMLRGLLVPPYRVLAKAGHNVGKTMGAAAALLWWHLTRSPAIIISTAPKLEQVRDLLWKEVRRQSRGLVAFAGPRICRIDRAADDFAVGTTARTGTALQGHHGESLLFIFDEAVGVASEFWEVAETMFAGTGHAWLCLFNPTDHASRAYREEHADRPIEEGWRVVTLSCLEHPNIAAELAGQPPPIPAAVRLARLDRMLKDWCERVMPGDRVATDIEWPPASGTFLRPGPIAECRLLGRWPSQSFYSVWGDALWQAACTARLDWGSLDHPVLGCDVARFGDDNTEIHGRRGPCSYHHEAHNGWDGVQIAGRLKELAREAARAYAPDVYDGLDAGEREKRAKRVQIVVDDTGGIGGVYENLARAGFRCMPVNSASAARLDLEYHNVRSELWFVVRDLAKHGRLDFSRLPDRVRAELRTQAMAQNWKVDERGRRYVLPKDEVKEELGRSPDGMDAVNLAYYPAGDGVGEVVKPAATKRAQDRGNDRAGRGEKRRRLFGR